MSKELFAGIGVLQDARPDVDRTGLIRDIFFAPESIGAAAGRLLEAEYHLEDISGLDTLEGILVTYHFDHFEKPGRLALRVLAPHDTPKVPSIACIFGGAEWHERELSDFYGVVFEGNPNPAPLLLAETEALRPLIKSKKARKPVCDLIHPGEIDLCENGFDLFASKNIQDSDEKEAKD